MSIAQLSSASPTWLNRGGHAISERAAVQRQSNPSADAPGQSAKTDAPARRNPLVAALLEALQGLVPAVPPAATTAAPASVAATATATTTAAVATASTSGVPTATLAPAAAPAATPAPSSAPVDLKQLAYAFAHELYSALRSAGSGEDDGPARGDRPENPGNNGHHGLSKGAYGDLARGLEALARSLGTAPMATLPPSSAPANAVTPATTPVAPPAALDGAGATPSASAVSTTVPTAVPTTTVTTAPAATPAAAAPADSPLLAAFKGLLAALAPSTAPGTSSTGSASEKLAAFLHQMAQSLGLGSSAPASSLPAPGSLLNVTA